MIFLKKKKETKKKKINFVHFFVNALDNLWLDEKKNPRAKYSLNYKSENVDFLLLLFKLFGLKNCKRWTNKQTKKQPKKSKQNKTKTKTNTPSKLNCEKSPI